MSANLTVDCWWPGYRWYSNAFACGPLNQSTPVVPCCIQGDTCLSDNICSYTHSLEGGSGYYTAGCSDGGFLNTTDESVCSDRCGSNPHIDVTYVESSGLWHCCGSSDNGTVLDCSDPATDSFRAAAPSDLISYWSAGETTATASPTASPSSTSIASASASATTTSSSDSSSGLSTGAKAGVGVGVAAGVILVIVAALLFFLRNRKRQGHTPVNTHDSDMASVPAPSQYEYSQPISPDPILKPTYEMAHEGQYIQELPANVHELQSPTGWAGQTALK